MINVILIQLKLIVNQCFDAIRNFMCLMVGKEIANGTTNYFVKLFYVNVAIIVCCFLSDAICSDTYTRTAGQRITADQTNTCVYYLLSNVNGKCFHTKLRCPPGKKVSENFYFMPASEHPCNYDIDPKLEKPCQRRNHPNDLIYQMVPWECYGDTTCCFHEIGQAAEDC